MLNEYIAKIKWAKNDKEIREILKTFYFESVCSSDFRKQIDNDMAEESEGKYIE
ncbi:hypothetical protein [Caproiciproducens sp.]